MLPAVAQGDIGVECRADDDQTLAFLAALEHRESARCVAAERALLAALDGSCRTPIAALAETRAGEQLYRRALIARPDGTTILHPLTYFALDTWLAGFASRIDLTVWLFLIPGLVVMALALLTVSYQAIKAALANPVRALRYE